MIADEVLMNKIYYIRGQNVILDRYLSELNDGNTGNLNKAVKRSIKRFTDDFMFQLSDNEFKNLIFQTGTSSWEVEVNDGSGKHGITICDRCRRLLMEDY